MGNGLLTDVSSTEDTTGASNADGPFDSGAPAAPFAAQPQNEKANQKKKVRKWNAETETPWREAKLALCLEGNHAPRRDGAGGDGCRWREWGRRGFADSSVSASASAPLASSRLWRPFLSPDEFRF